MKLFAVLVCSHVLADFLLQPDQMVKNKHRFLTLMAHSAIHALLTYLVLAQWRFWSLPALVFMSHVVIDFIKQHVPDTAVTFAADQTAHIAVLAGLACCLNRFGLSAGMDFLYTPLILSAGFAATVMGSGFLIAKVAKRLVDENELNLDGLQGGGKLIGRLERTLIFLLVLIGQPAGIGFLVAAKSILRFQETKDQKLAEYVLIGTLLSFSLAIALSSLTIRALKL